MLTLTTIIKFLPYIAVLGFGLGWFIYFRAQALKIKKLKAEIKKKDSTIKSQQKSLSAMQASSDIAKELLKSTRAISLNGKRDATRDKEIIERAKRLKNDKEIWSNIDDYFSDIVGK